MLRRARITTYFLPSQSNINTHKSFDMDPSTTLVSRGYVTKKRNTGQGIKLGGGIIYVDVGEKKEAEK